MEEHVCGLQGFDPMRGDSCPKCSESTRRRARSVCHSSMKPWELHLIAREDWIRNRWGGFTYLVIGRNENFILDFQDGSLFLLYESDTKDSPVARVLLFEQTTRQGVMDVEWMFGCNQAMDKD